MDNLQGICSAFFNNKLQRKSERGERNLWIKRDLGDINQSQLSTSYLDLDLIQLLKKMLFGIEQLET